MKATRIAAALTLLCCSSLFAADATPNRWRISVLASEISNTHNEPQSADTHSGVGVGVAYALTEAWDVEMTVASRSHISPYYHTFIVLGPDGPQTPPYTVFEYREYRVMPGDLSVTRHFLTDQPIAPYVRAGLRYVEAPSSRKTIPPIVTVLDPPYAVVEDPSGQGYRLHDRTSAQFGAGVRIRLTPRTAVRAEVNRLIRSDRADFDPLTRFAVGLSWLF